PLVLAGDLNLIDRPFAGGRYADADAHGYRALLDRLHLADAWREHDRRAAGFTFDPATNPYAARGRCRHIPGQRIDYVLYRPHAGLRCPQAALVFTEAPHLSDHYGVLADLLLPPKISASSAGGVTSSWS
ncbi:MAG TPA: endonuclease/exonuclease/phosphatase family protein, partial [Vicinamibacteria bacterium]|nr:endonuclease/exonuclease/phosphatase family protein [Vicinamibacteria bacterium]